MDAFLINNAKREDGEEILQLTANAGVFKPTEVSTLGEIWDEYLRNGADVSGYYFIACRENGHLYGYACFGPHPLTEGAYDLYWLAVEQGHRGRGIGHALLQKVESEIARLGGRIIVVETSSLEEYSPARHLYATAGYQAEAMIRDFYSPGDHLVTFTKHLDGKVKKLEIRE